MPRHKTYGQYKRGLLLGVFLWAALGWIGAGDLQAMQSTTLTSRVVCPQARLKLVNPLTMSQAGSIGRRLELYPAEGVRAPLPQSFPDSEPAFPDPEPATELEVALEGRERLHATRRILWLGTLQLGVQYSITYTSEPANWKIHGNNLEPSWDKFRSNFSVPPVWEPQAYGGGGFMGYLQADGDIWVTNVIGHGLQGSEIYLRMRREGFLWWEALLGGALHSTVWEYGVEGWNETPSAFDLAFTPVGGWLLGELRMQALQFLHPRRRHWLAAGLTFVVDPVGALQRARR